jgi:L-asparaginase
MRITTITTGGTIAKTYNEWDGSLRNDRPIVESMLASLRLPDLAIRFEHILNKDSLDLTDDDRRRITEAVRHAAADSDGVMVIHGTDTLAVTGDLLHRELPGLAVPVVLTGAMRPYEFRDTDAAQNVTEALLACRLLPPGVYVAMHNRVLRFPGVRKDRTTLTFVKDAEAASPDA